MLFRSAGGAELVLESPQYGIAPGQACVFYDGTRVMGGGWIVSADGMANGCAAS